MKDRMKDQIRILCLSDEEDLRVVNEEILRKAEKEELSKKGETTRMKEKCKVITVTDPTYNFVKKLAKDNKLYQTEIIEIAINLLQKELKKGKLIKRYYKLEDDQSSDDWNFPIKGEK